MATTPVSYTHLDVYKRQVLNHPATESQTRPQALALLEQLGCPADGPAADLDAVVAEVLA